MCNLNEEIYRHDETQEEMKIEKAGVDCQEEILASTSPYETEVSDSKIRPLLIEEKANPRNEAMKRNV